MQTVGFARRFHDLRHAGVALAIAEGAHPKAIQTRMGQSSINVTIDRGDLFSWSAMRRSPSASVSASPRIGARSARGEPLSALRSVASRATDRCDTGQMYGISALVQ